MKPKVYLAGPIAGQTYDQTVGWRAFVIQELKKHGIVGLSPLRNKTYLKELDTMPDTYDHPLSTSRAIMTRDHFDCHRSDAVLAYLPEAGKRSIGTVMECAWAYAYRKPLVVVMKDDGIYDHPMIREAAGYLVSDLNVAVGILVSLFSEPE
jgi:nucleoside 2-deoxyribosyltransferase